MANVPACVSIYTLYNDLNIPLIGSDQRKHFGDGGGGLNKCKMFIHIMFYYS